MKSNSLQFLFLLTHQRFETRLTMMMVMITKILMMGPVLMLMMTGLLMMMLRMMMAAMMLRMADDMCVRECLFQKIMLMLKMSIGC